MYVSYPREILVLIVLLRAGAAASILVFDWFTHLDDEESAFISSFSLDSAYEFRFSRLTWFGCAQLCPSVVLHCHANHLVVLLVTTTTSQNSSFSFQGIWV